MAAPGSSVIFFPSGFTELFAVWKNHPSAVLCAGGAEFTANRNARVPAFPEYVISLDKMADLHKVSRTERYLEIGAMVKLNRIIGLGKIVPDALVRCLENIGGHQVRNIATIGGNICTASRRLDSALPLAALDAHFELRGAQTSRWISAPQFFSFPVSASLAPNELLARIRVPLEAWTFTLYRKFDSSSVGYAGPGALFIISNQKNILTNIRVVYSGNTILRDKSAETLLAGKQLPLDRKAAKAFLDSWDDYLSAAEGGGVSVFPSACGVSRAAFMKKRLLAFIEDALLRISD